MAEMHTETLLSLLWTMERGQMIRGWGFLPTPSHVMLGMKVVEHPPLIAALHGQRLRRRAMDLKLKDKVALITGSSRGIGLATAKAFAAEGCCLVLSARSAEPLAAAEAALRADGGAVASCLADVGQPDQAARLVEAAAAAFGGIDIL